MRTITNLSLGPQGTAGTKVRGGGNYRRDNSSWMKISTLFVNIKSDIYINYNYGHNIYVVFDGYKKNSTKSMERMYRSKRNACNDMIFDKSMPLKIKQEKFLANAKNKSSLIDMLRETFAENKIFSCQAEADRLIIETAINLQSENIVVVSEDVDVSFIDCALTNRSRNLFSKTRQRQNTTKSVLF